MKYILFCVLFISFPLFATEPRTCPTCTPPNLIHAAQKSVDEAASVTYFRKRNLILKKGLHWANTCVEKFPAQSECVRLQQEINQLLNKKHHK